MAERCASFVCFWIALLAIPQIGLGQILPKHDWSILQVLRFGDKVEVTMKNNKSIMGQFGQCWEIRGQVDNYQLTSTVLER